MTLALSSKLSIKDVDLASKKILMRVDFNVPLDENGKVTNDQRIKSTIPTIQYALSKDPKSVILMSHLGRPDGKKSPKYSLKPVVSVLSSLLGKSVKFCTECVGPEVEKTISESTNGDVILLENLRFHIEEEGSGTDENGQKIKADPSKVKAFRESLTRLGDIYVNDAFGTAHRSHSSMVGIALPTRVSGFLMQKELDFLSKVVQNPSRPFLAILGGAKVADKIQLIENLITKVDSLIIAGGMAYTFKKVIDKISIGNSIYDENGAHLVEKIVASAKSRGVEIAFPIDHVVADKFDKNANSKLVTDKEGIPNGWMGMDIGPESISRFQQMIESAKTILWNGPVGVFEMTSFEKGTKNVLKAVVDATRNKATSIAGGGDTAAAVEKWGAEKDLSHVSTGGGASLELLEGKELPGVVALSDAH